MRQNWTLRRTVATSLAVLALCSVAVGQDNLSEPVYRVAADTSTPATATAATTTSATATPATAAVATKPANKPIDFTKQGDEHPLMPVVRGLKASRDNFDATVRDYSCTFVKRERIDGELGDQQFIFMKVMQEPFSVYMSFLKPSTGREVLYVAGQNDGKLVALDVGVKRYLGKISLDPNGAMAMKGQKHPITSVGIRNLTEKLIKLHEDELQYQECEVTVNPSVPIITRNTTMVQVVHPTPRKTFKNHVARIFIDNELHVPIHYDAYSWPTENGGQPLLEESYTYQNLKLNNNFTGRDFDPNNNPDIFK